jgi:type 1 glutamine amidotransferase
MLPSKSALLLLGGAWHDFDGFARSLGSLLETHGWGLEASYDLDRILSLEQDQPRLVILYTCFIRPGEAGEQHGPDRMSETQIAALANWIRKGGALLAAHASTVLGNSSPLLGDLVGGEFIEHPPLGPFTVYPLFERHPITAGLSAFTVQDELYFEESRPSVNVHMVAVHDGLTYPQVWSKDEGRGRVAHIALGHTAAVWEMEAYQRLVRQTIDWLTRL